MSLGLWMLFGKRKRIVKRILIVEDEPLVAFDNEVMLGDAGYDVVATLDGFDEAIELIEREQVDLILSDVRLKGRRTGVDLAKAAKARGIPVLFASGHAPPEGAPEFSLGCLMKPYTERQLRLALDSVDRFLGGKKVKPSKGLHFFAIAED